MANQTEDAQFDPDSLSLKLTKPFHKQTYPRLDPRKTTFEAKGKTILITAGATGIGFEISKAFAQAGVKKIIVVSRRAEPQTAAKKALEAEFPGTEIQCVQASVTDYPKMTQVLKDAGGIDVLVICHFLAHTLAVPSREIPIQELQACFDTNVIAPTHLLQQYLALPMPAAGTKTVIHVSSAAAHIELPRQTGYGPSKTAFSRMLGSYFATEQGIEKDGVRLFSYHPGAFYTAAAQEHYAEDAMPWEDIKLPAHFAVWLASREADFLHGRFLWAHWDVDDMMARFPEKFAKQPGFLKLGLTS